MDGRGVGDGAVARDGAVVGDAGRPSLVWALVHPSASPGIGLYLFDETSQVIVRQLPLPPGCTSPQALAWDGRSLWLGGIDEDCAVRELDPESGRVLSRWEGVHTEGIAVSGETFWYSAIRDAFAPLVQVRRDGETLDMIELREITVQDLVNANGTLYFLANDDVDRIVRVEPATGATRDIVRGVHTAPYSLGFDGTHLAVAIEGTILRFDPATGARVSTRPFAVPGWITAIAFVR